MTYQIQCGAETNKGYRCENNAVSSTMFRSNSKKGHRFYSGARCALHHKLDRTVPYTTRLVVLKATRRHRVAL